MRALARLLMAAVLVAPAACGSDSGGTPVYADRVVAYAPVIAAGVDEADWPYFFAPALALGAPGGLFDVASLGYDPDATDAPGGSITLGLGEAEGGGSPACAVDGDGDDLAVYENPFVTVDPATDVTGTNSEVATLEVSADGVDWYAFPATLDDGLPLVAPARYGNLAGVTPTAEGGDRFDLAGVIAANGLPPDFSACYLRLTDGGTRYPDFGNTQTDLTTSGADIDAVQALHAAAAPGLEP